MKIDKRTALKTVGASTAGIAGFYHIGEVRGTDYVEVPTVLGEDDEVLKKRVPKSWYEHAKRADRIIDSRRSELISNDGVVRTSLTQSKL